MYHWQKVTEDITFDIKSRKRKHFSRIFVKRFRGSGTILPGNCQVLCLNLLKQVLATNISTYSRKT